LWFSFIATTGELRLVDDDGAASGSSFHKERSYPSEQAPIIDRELWDMVQARLAGNDAQRGADGQIA